MYWYKTLNGGNCGEFVRTNIIIYHLKWICFDGYIKIVTYSFNNLMTCECRYCMMGDIYLWTNNRNTFMRMLCVALWGNNIDWRKVLFWKFSITNYLALETEQRIAYKCRHGGNLLRNAYILKKKACRSLSGNSLHQSGYFSNILGFIPKRLSKTPCSKSAFPEHGFYVICIVF